MYTYSEFFGPKWFFGQGFTQNNEEKAYTFEQKSEDLP